MSWDYRRRNRGGAERSCTGQSWLAKRDDFCASPRLVVANRRSALSASVTACTATPSGCMCAESEKSVGSASRIGFRQACTCVLALWKLRVGVEAYYLAQVASGLDEYYTGGGEAPGRWMGGGVAGLGLTGEVAPSDLRAVLAGLSPDTGLTPNGATLSTHPRRVPGFDLTFSVPKSVSVLFGLGHRLVQHAVVEG